ncbi:hypothetical protein M0R88_06385 [Halorussus gelatinilyticus]|uniref:DUF8107 domain-containing protein n=1 Tax=Halorussus gelatinilyticus TaxID=2937524 RepID=A0A8U0IM52_9EURY|nr:hypothetical protein [Halorussus gelatinilyticus]UPW01725.1 hypothetical protein M0R88_06385 [Halorussus gelatinilyticus]
MANSTGDPRVLFAMNLVLSAAFSWVLVSALSFVGVTPFSWRRVALTTAGLVVLTYVVVE